MLLLAAPTFAQDDSEALFGPAEDEDAGPDYARDGYYIQFGYSWGHASKLADKLDGNRDKWQLEPQQEDKIKDERLVDYINQTGPAPVPGQRENPLRDGPCTAANAMPRCDIFFEGTEAQIGGTIRTQATPGLRPGVPTQFLSGIQTLGTELGNTTIEDSHGLDVRVGSRVLPNLAVELQLEYQSGFEVDIPNYAQAAPPPGPPPFPAGEFVDDDVTYLRASDTDKINVQLLNLTVNLKVPLLTGRIQPFVLLGGGAVFVFRDNRFPRAAIEPGATSGNPYLFREYVDVRDVGTVFRIGGGIDTYITEHIFVATEATWVAAQGEAMNDLRHTSVTISAGYRF